MHTYIYSLARDANSVHVHTYNVGNEEDLALDFDAVQRGDAEMENRMNRVIRACIDLGENNPIVSIHDQGAGGRYTYANIRTYKYVHMYLCIHI